MALDRSLTACSTSSAIDAVPRTDGTTVPPQAFAVAISQPASEMPESASASKFCVPAQDLPICSS